MIEMSVLLNGSECVKANEQMNRNKRMLKRNEILLLNICKECINMGLCD